MTTPSRYLLLAVGCLILSAQPTVLAENTKKPTIQILEGPVGSEGLDRQIRLARQLIQHDDYHGAAAVLEPLQSEQPGHDLIYTLLRRCYQKLGYEPKLADLTRRMIVQHPDHYRYHLDLATDLIRTDRPDESLESFYRSAKLTRTDGEFINVTNSMMNSGFAVEALELVDSQEIKSDRSSAFALQRGVLLEAQRLYPEAVLAYLPVLEDTTRDGVNAERRLLNLLEFNASSEIAEATLLKNLDEAPSGRALTALTSFYLKAGRLDEAYRFTLRLDTTQKMDGQALVRFMRSCSERRQFDLAAQMGRYFIDNYRSSPVTTDAYFVYADALTQMGQYEAAIAVYDSLVSWTPRVQEKGEGLYFVGMIYLDHLADYPTARRCFDSVVTNYPRGVGYIRSHVARPYCDLRQGKLKAAAMGFSALAQMQLNEDVAEEIDYHLALIDYCQGSYDSAGVALQRLTVNYPRGFYVNDALQLMMVMDRVGQDKQLMAGYAQALLYELRREPDSLAAALAALAGGQTNALGDLALYRLMNMSLAKEDTLRVLDYVKRLEDRFPESYYYPYGLKMRADLYRNDGGRIDEAKTIYRQLLEDFPNYPFASEVRQFLRELEDDSPIG